MVAIEKMFEEMDNRVADVIGGRVGMVVRFKGGVKARKSGV